jgi:hypothetical protein
MIPLRVEPVFARDASVVPEADDEALIRGVVAFVRAAETALPPDQRAERFELFAPLHAMLLAHCAEASPGATAFVDALARACFRPRHLWQDLGATGREEVSRLMLTCLPALYHANVRNLRWKRHLFLQLGERLGREDLRPPKCDGCGDFEFCFGAPAPVNAAR